MDGPYVPWTVRKTPNFQKHDSKQKIVITAFMDRPNPKKKRESIKGQLKSRRIQYRIYEQRIRD